MEACFLIYFKKLVLTSLTIARRTLSVEITIPPSLELLARLNEIIYYDI